jgi:LmbE family N-acetylglucosaminyl deacetylase
MNTHPHLGPGDLGTILSIWAHPDDETYLAGGIMAAAAAAGQRVICVSATAGEHGTDDPETWPPARLGRVRRWEAAAAMAVLGVADHRFLDYSDGDLAAMDPTGPVGRIADLIVAERPDTILTFGPDGITFHSDHVTVSGWVGTACEKVGFGGRLMHSAGSAEHWAIWGPRYEEWGVFMTDERPRPIPRDAMDLRLHLTGEAMDRKVAALAAMHTQIGPSMALLGDADFRSLNEEECFVTARS